MILPLVVTILSIFSLKDAMFIASFVLGAAMSIIVYTDAKYFIIPDVISLPMIPLGILSTAYFSQEMSINYAILYSSISAFFGFGVFYLVKVIYLRFRKIDGLGMGDVKIAAVAGAWTGFTGLNAVLLISCFSALALVLIGHAFGRKISARTAIPFGLFLAPAIWIVWYLQAIGYLGTHFI